MVKWSAGLWTAFGIVPVVCVGHDLGVLARHLVILLLLANFVVGLAASLRLRARHDIDVHDKFSWVIAILLLGGLGGILYFLLGPAKTPRPPAANGEMPPDADDEMPPATDDEVPPDAPVWDPDGMRWNPVFGVNSRPAGAGLTPTAASEEQDNESSDPGEPETRCQ